MEQAAGKKKILIVDDSPEILLLLKTCLEKSGFEVLQAVNGLDALTMTRQHMPALVIMDRMMPKMDGLKACALIKSDRRSCHIPVIMLTSSAEASVRKLSEQVKADAFLNKPLNTDELVAKIQEMLVRA
jgi:two-component system alkaline phosphatase synthesis response regulator PhoP